MKEQKNGGIYIWENRDMKEWKNEKQSIKMGWKMEWKKGDMGNLKYGGMGE